VLGVSCATWTGRAKPIAKSNIATNPGHDVFHSRVAKVDAIASRSKMAENRSIGQTFATNALPQLGQVRGARSDAQTFAQNENVFAPQFGQAYIAP